MKKHLAIFYFLFLLLIMGTFASMAQNTYGLKICGVACFGFAIAFLIDAIRTFNLSADDIPSWLSKAESGIMAGVAVFFMLKNFSITFNFGNAVLGLLLVSLLLFTVYRATVQLRISTEQRRAFTPAILVYYAAIIILIGALLAGLVLPSAENLTGVAGIVLVAALVVLIILAKKTSGTEESLTAWDYLKQLEDKSVILLISGLLLAIFSLTTSSGVLPQLYHDDMPTGYYQLTEKEALNPEKVAQFETRYKTFIERWGE